MERCILHCDMNGFYASVESLYYPQYRGQPLAVCGDPQQRHGIILAKNELAKHCGIVTAETIQSARRKCPELVLVPAHFDRYERASSYANEIYRRFTDLVEPFSIDESFLDVTGTTHLFGDGRTIADRLRLLMKNELGLTISVGVSFNKIFAKLGSDYKKPDATTVITPDNYRELVWPLPVGALMYAGQKTAEKLRQIGVTTIGALAGQDLTLMRNLLGKHGEMLWHYARGEDREPVAVPDPEDIKSIGKGMTFPHDLTREEEISCGVLALAGAVGERLRARHLRAGAVSVTLRTPDFRDTGRQLTLAHPTCSTQEIAGAASALIRQNRRPGAPLRMITVTAMRLVPDTLPEQLSLFEEDRAARRSEALDRSLDSIRKKYGKLAPRPASLLKDPFHHQ